MLRTCLRCGSLLIELEMDWKISECEWISTFLGDKKYLRTSLFIWQSHQVRPAKNAVSGVMQCRYRPCNHEKTTCWLVELGNAEKGA